MTDGPTTMNGPLHTSEATINDREMIASFATPDQAAAVRQQLIQAGIAADRVCVTDHATNDTTARQAGKPADDTLIGRVREAILPDDGAKSTLAAVQNDDAILTLKPLPEEVEMAVSIIEKAGPSHFDADLERWRNAG